MDCARCWRPRATCCLPCSSPSREGRNRLRRRRRMGQVSSGEKVSTECAWPALQEAARCTCFSQLSSVWCSAEQSRAVHFTSVVKQFSFRNSKQFTTRSYKISRSLIDQRASRNKRAGSQASCFGRQLIVVCSERFSSLKAR